MRKSSSTLITEVPEIDLYECLKYDQMRNLGQLRTYLPPPYQGYVYIQLCRTRGRYGWRPWFQAPCCRRRTSKLYVFGTRIACRQCLGLKYPSQYRKDPFSRSVMTQRKLQRLQKQERRLWYGDYPTRFGAHRSNLLSESERQTLEMLCDIQKQRMQMGADIAPTLN